jgi:hypothetical protein
LLCALQDGRSDRASVPVGSVRRLWFFALMRFSDSEPVSTGSSPGQAFAGKRSNAA